MSGTMKWLTETIIMEGEMGYGEMIACLLKYNFRFFLIYDLLFFYKYFTFMLCIFFAYKKKQV